MSSRPTLVIGEERPRSLGHELAELAKLLLDTPLVGYEMTAAERRLGTRVHSLLAGLGLDAVAGGFHADLARYVAYWHLDATGRLSRPVAHGVGSSLTLEAERERHRYAQYLLTSYARQVPVPPERPAWLTYAFVGHPSASAVLASSHDELRLAVVGHEGEMFARSKLTPLGGFSVVEGDYIDLPDGDGPVLHEAVVRRLTVPERVRLDLGLHPWAVLPVLAATEGEA